MFVFCNTGLNLQKILLFYSAYIFITYLTHVKMLIMLCSFHAKHHLFACTQNEAVVQQQQCISKQRFQKPKPILYHKTADQHSKHRAIFTTQISVVHCRDNTSIMYALRVRLFVDYQQFTRCVHRLGLILTKPISSGSHCTNLP